MTIPAEQFMQRALELARQGLGRTAPNPPVGAVVVRDNEIVGEGFHPAAGQPHAEVFALRDAGELSRGADLYVTLEPCCHQGRTGPCTKAVIEAGVSRVFVGSKDPNPQVSGRGVEQLQAAGIEVVTDLLLAECRDLIGPFRKHVTTGLPHVVYKAAMTLDGQTATSAGDSKWISCEASRHLVHQLRNRVDGIVVGSGTVNVDNPRLTTRLESAGRDPVRIIIDGGLATSPQATVYNLTSKAQTVLVTAFDHAEESLAPYLARKVSLVQVERTEAGLDLRAAMLELAKLNLHSLLLEGGSKLAAAMLDAELIDRMMVFVAPKLVGGSSHGLFAGNGVARITQSHQLVNMQACQVDEDFLIEGEVQYVHRSD